MPITPWPPGWIERAREEQELPSLRSPRSNPLPNFYEQQWITQAEIDRAAGTSVTTSTVQFSNELQERIRRATETLMHSRHQEFFEVTEPERIDEATTLHTLSMQSLNEYGEYLHKHSFIQQESEMAITRANQRKQILKSVIASIEALNLNKNDPASPPFKVFVVRNAYGDALGRIIWERKNDRFWWYSGYGPSHMGDSAATAAELLVVHHVGEDPDAYPLSMTRERMSANRNTPGVISDIVIARMRSDYDRPRGSSVRNNIVTRWANALQSNMPMYRQSPRLVFRGQETDTSPHSWLSLKYEMEQATALIRRLRDSENNDQDDVAVDMCDFLNRSVYLGHSTRMRIANAFNGMVVGSNDEIGFMTCGHWETSRNEHSIGGGNCCESCFEDDSIVVYSDAEDEYLFRNDAHYYDDDWHSEANPYDEDDEDSCDRSGLSNWGRDTTHTLDHDQSFDSSPTGDFIMGVELEVECSRGSEMSSALRGCASHFNKDITYAMFKRDGSLSDRGFEIVTAARTLDDHLDRFKAWTPHPTLRAWQPGNCGVHVHIDSRAFSALTLGKFLMFIASDVNESMIKSIAGRHPRSDNQARQYCAAPEQHTLEQPNKALKGGHHSRYRMVNLANLTYEEKMRLGAEANRDCKGSYSTVELRIFRASLKKERLLAQIEFTHAAVMFCRTASYKKLTEAGFKEWLASNGRRYRHLCRWFGVTVVRPNTKTGNATPVAATAEV